MKTEAPLPKPRLGLALSSGGAKGLAHVGVLQVLEENNIPVSVVSGCSMGSYIGALWAYGCDGVELGRLAMELKGRWGSWKLIDPAFPPRRGFIHGDAVERRLRRTIGDARFIDLKCPLRVVATNLNTLEPVVFDIGEVARAVHASCAVPGVCEPVRIDGEIYVDGGICDPVPVGALRRFGVDRIIAVNTLPTPERLRRWREREQERNRARRASKRSFGFWRFLNRHLNYLARGNILDNLLRSFHGAQMRIAEDACQEADAVIRPLSSNDHWSEFHRPEKFIALGRRAAEEKLDEIRALLKPKETNTQDHEHQSPKNPLAIAA